MLELWYVSHGDQSRDQLYEACSWSTTGVNYVTAAIHLKLLTHILMIILQQQAVWLIICINFRFLCHYKADNGYSYETDVNSLDTGYAVKQNRKRKIRMEMLDGEHCHYS